jgi:ubiquitin-protein ligase
MLTRTNDCLSDITGAAQGTHSSYASLDGLPLTLRQMQQSLPPGITIVKAENLEEWLMDVQVLDSNPLYLNQIYRLKFTFSKNYPIGRMMSPYTDPISDDWTC